MIQYPKRPYCCTPMEWKEANYGIKLDDTPFAVFKTNEHMERAYKILKERHPSSKWYMVVKTKGVY